MLKNYTVIIKNVMLGKQNKIINYLENEEHKNHKKTKIICSDNSEIFKDSLLDKIHENNKNYLRSKKGGRRLKRIAKSITFNIPPFFNSTLEQVEEVNTEFFIQFVNLLNSYDIKLNRADLFTAIHYQENPHFHLILPTLDNNGKNIRKFNTTAFAKELKLLFTESVDKVLKTDIKKVKPLTEEEQAHNTTIRELKALKNEYIKALDGDIQSNAIKYIKNQLVVIERTLKADKIENKYINALNSNAEKITKAKNNVEISTKLTTR